MKRKTNKRKEKFRNKTRKTRGGKKETIHYPNGDVYEGDVIIVDDKPTPQGKGQMTYKEQDEASGLEDCCGDMYIGDWVNGKRHGKGKMIYRKSLGKELEYEGDWINGEKQGKGIMKWGESADNLYRTYEGEFVNNDPKGHGKLTWQNGNVYEGDVVECRTSDEDEPVCPDGTGTMTYGENEDGIQSYEGDWEYGTKYGIGIMRFNDGRIFEGLWEDDEPICDTDADPAPYLEGPWFNNGEYRTWKCITPNFIDIMMGDRHIHEAPHMVALEVHQAAAKINLDKYLEVIGEPNSPPYPNIKEYTLGKFVPYITERFPQEKDVMIERLTALMNRMNAAVDIVTMPKKKEVVKKTLDFVFKQPPEFIDNYIKTFIKDCYSAYSGAQGEAGMSCVGGIYERFYMIVGDIIYQLCPDENTCEYENKEVYEKLLKVFRKRITKASVIQDWAIIFLDSDVIKAMSPEERKQHLIEFMRKEYRDMDMLDEHNEAIIQKEANDLDARHVFENLEFGGGGTYGSFNSTTSNKVEVTPWPPTPRTPLPHVKKGRRRSAKKTRKNKK